MLLRVIATHYPGVSVDEAALAYEFLQQTLGLSESERVWIMPRHPHWYDKVCAYEG